MPLVERILEISPEEYLAGEKDADFKHEYVAGRVYATSGASAAHNLISGNIHALLHAHLRGGPCRVFMADMKVRTAAAFYYPDVLVACDPTDRHGYYRERPSLIVEVTSRSTEIRDHLDKRSGYQTLPSLQEYVLVAQDRMEVQVYRRRPEGWERETYAEGDEVRFNSVELTVPIADVYEQVRA